MKDVWSSYLKGDANVGVERKIAQVVSEGKP